jgi:hypothetical protein
MQPSDVGLPNTFGREQKCTKNFENAVYNTSETLSRRLLIPNFVKILQTEAVLLWAKEERDGISESLSETPLN